MKLIAVGSQVFVSRVGQVLANAAAALLIAKTLGPTGQGYYSLTAAAALLLASLLAGGVGLAAVPPLRRRVLSLGRVLRAQAVWMAVALAAVLLLAGWSLHPPVADFLGRHLGWNRGLGFLVAGMVLGILCFETLSYDLLARGRLVIGSGINGARALIHLVAVGGLSLAGVLSLGAAVGVAAAAQLLGAGLVLGVVLRDFRRDRGYDRTAAEGGQDAALPAHLARLPLRDLVVFLVRRGWVGQISAVAYFLLLRLDQALVVHYCGAAEVGVYSVAVYLGEMLWLLPGALTPLLVHSSAAAPAAGLGAAAPPAAPDGSAPRDRTALQAVRLGLAVTLAAGIPLYLLSGFLLPLLAGAQYAASAASLRALLPGIIAFAPGAVLAGDFIGRGKPHWNTQASLLTVAVNVVCGVLLIPRYGAVGAGWASSIAYACGSAVMLVRFVRTTGTPWRALIRPV